MRVKVKDIKPNPFRNIDHYPIDRDKVEALKRSIESTDFWDNILARKNDKGEIELAYGHHRLEALKEVGIEEVDIPVRDINDTMMLKIMANENLDQWRPNTAIINETVLAAKEFLDAELAKYESWETLNEFIKSLFKDSRGFENAKHQGAGQTTILKFLGGNWKQKRIQDALAILRDKDLDRSALELFESPSHAEAFRQAIKEEPNLFPQRQTSSIGPENKKPTDKRRKGNNGSLYWGRSSEGNPCC